MKFCQIKRKNKIIILFIFILFFGLYFNNVKAFGNTNITQITKDIGCKDVPEGHAGQAKEAVEEQLGSGVAIKTIDLFVAGKLEKINCIDNRSFIKRVMDQVTTWSIQETKWLLEEATAQAYKAALKNFLNTLAYDMATYLATGDKGQLPMFETEGWGGYLKNVADDTAGAVIEELGKKSPIQFNLCSPSSDVMLKINLGLHRSFRPEAPACTFSQLVNDWDAALNDKDFLPKFQDMFNPWSNDLGIALTLQTGIESEISRKVNEAAHDRLEGEGFKPVRDPIIKAIKTPSKVVRDATKKAFGDSNKDLFVYTGNTIADSIDIFINTLIGKLIDKWLKKGLVTDFPAHIDRFNNLGPNSLTDPNAQKQDEGIAGAASRFRSLVEPNFKVRGDYNILAELAMCPDPNKAGPTNCVIDEKFRGAIEKRLTVKQALDQGHLSANGVFGFMSDGLEPKYNEGYPYRSMLILRKFRIIPVGWEIAAQYIKDCQNNIDPAKCQQGNVSGTKSLSYLVNCAAAWCVGLVDPNWVLKAPQNFCAREGPGPEILSEQVTGEGAASLLSILRNDTYCADEKSLIKENSSGSNPLYGYCTEERRVWDFNAKSCAPRDNTCQTFQSEDQTVSYLQNTLDFGVCNAGNAGCAKYATNGSYINDAVVWSGNNNNPIYLNKQAESCEAADQGCYGFIRITPEQDETYNEIKSAGIDKAYQRFSASGLIYEKLLPDYLKDICYDNQGRLKISAPAQCSNFVRECKEIEAGCELYTSVIDGFKIPAKVQPLDYCPAECVGYDTFVQKETTFASSREAYFIPKTAKICSAESSGCDEFTNLEKIATTTPNVAEQKEYYTYLRQCLKPDTAGKFCGEFYNWEGSDESGYQLKVASLESTSADDNGEPVLTVIYDPAECDQTIYNSPVGDPRHNDDCQQFYNRLGDVFYRLYSNTKDCSDNCHPYRRTELNIDENITEADCLGAADRHWAGEKCVVCKSGGVWSAENNACIYMAIPGQGAACPAAQNGCREYNGNTGNDVRNIFTDDFSGGITGGWIGVNDSLVTPSSEALTLDSDNKGNSLSISGGSFSARRLVGNSVIQGKAYVLSFLAKADGGNTALNVSLATTTAGAKAYFAAVALSADWQIYKTNLTNLNHKVMADEFLLIEAGQNFYIDNIVLTEIVDRYYLIKDSWNTPLTCDSDQSDNLPGEALGCDQYANRANKTHYLKSFNQLCSESAVGCELMIDTKNSSAATASFYKDGQKVEAASGADLIVPADSFTYVVYDQDKLCNQEAKGCALLGKSYKYENDTLYGDVYLKNNPDKYNQILCGADAVGCQAFAYNDGVKSGEKYFKDPGDQACEWRRQAGAGDHEGWFKKKIKRCGGDNGAICLSDANCTGGAKCQIEIADRSCPTADNKTLGLGGAGGKVSQPTVETLSNGTKVNWAGICAAANSGCGEYIDPVSRFNANIIFNGSFANLDNNINTIDGWGAGITQNVTLKPNTVYRLATKKNNSGSPVSFKINCLNNSSLYVINEDNELSASPRSDITVMASNARNSRIFYYRNNDEVSCTVSAGNDKGVVELKPAVISYQLAQNLDTQSCNGLVDFNQGCVLFNERNYDFASLKKLNSDADTSSFGSAAENEEDSNIILKVTPDRVCGKWLACRSYAKDEKDNNICYDVGLCDAVDDKGDCLSFIASSKTNQTIESLGADKISNLSGYAKVGLAGGSLGGDYYPLAAMKQKGEVVNLANGGFEFYGANNYPLGWTWGGQAAVNKPWDVNVFSVINNPIAAQTEGIGYAREGRVFLKLGSSYDAMSEDIDVLPNTPYIITAYANTKNLKSGQVMIDIINKDNAVIKSAVITQALGNDWQFQIGKFNSGNNSTIKIKLYASLSGGGALTSSEGNFYFDDVKIKPALNSKDNWYTAQSCRLYPKTDSLSCDYFEDSGKRQKGLPGYCLEYDRPPGNSSACILWYPIDRVKGDGIEEGGWYQGKFPVYYCLSASAVGCGVDGKALIKCDKVVRTVNSIGQNKYWSSHVYQGSDWFTANQDDSYINYDNTGLNKVDVGADDKQYNYSYDQTPFGSIAPPFNAIDNPFDWDSRAASGIQPLYLEVPPKSQSNLARAGSPFYCNVSQSCYLLTFHDGRTFQINSLEIEVFMSAVCGNACSLSFNGAPFINNATIKKVLIIGDNTIFLYSDAAGKSSGKGRCTNKMKAYIVLPNGEKAVLTKAGNETKIGGSAITDCGDESVDGGSAINYADGSFTTTFKVTYNDRKECQVNVNEGEAGAINRVKKLFAKSYGAWEWNDKAEVCVGGVKAGTICKIDFDCQSSCQGNCFYNNVNSTLSCNINQPNPSSCSGLDKGLCVITANPSEKVCVGGNKNFSVCAKIAASSAECKGCASQTFGTCNRVSQCQGGARDGQTCTGTAIAAANFCNNSCAGYTNGSCNDIDPDLNIVTLKCVGGNKAGNSCGENICQANSYGLKTCASGSKIGKYCSNNNDCDDCKGCAGNTYGVCELLGQCQNGARNGLICDLSQGDSQCNSLTTDLSTSNCGGAGYDKGDCVQKKICESGYNKGSVCSNVSTDIFNDNGWCESPQCYQCQAGFCSNGNRCSSDANCSGCYQCQASYCSDGRSCSSDAACSGTCGAIGYKPVFSQPELAWGPPGTLTNVPLDQDNGLCNRFGGGVRPIGAYCAILPQVSSIKVQGKADGLVELTTSQFINLTFNSKVDSQQLPLVMYAIDWGDNEKTVMTGAEMRDRPEASGNPHSLYHLYSYWDLKTKANSGITGIDCLIPGECKVNLKIQIKDNWGWCNKGQIINICGDEQWDSFNGTIVVKEK